MKEDERKLIVEFLVRYKMVINCGSKLSEDGHSLPRVRRKAVFVLS